MNNPFFLRIFRMRNLPGAGFTLLEVMVALTILGRSLLWLLKGQAVSLARNVGPGMACRHSFGEQKNSRNRADAAQGRLRNVSRVKVAGNSNPSIWRC